MSTLRYSSQAVWDCFSKKGEQHKTSKHNPLFFEYYNVNGEIKNYGWIKGNNRTHPEVLLFKKIQKKTGHLRIFAAKSPCFRCVDRIHDFLEDKPRMTMDIYFCTIYGLKMSDLTTWNTKPVRKTVLKMKELEGRTKIRNVKVIGQKEMKFIAGILSKPYNSTKKLKRNVWNMKTFGIEECSEIWQAIKNNTLGELAEKVKLSQALISAAVVKQNTSEIIQSFITGEKNYILYKIRNKNGHSFSSWINGNYSEDLMGCILANLAKKEIIHLDLYCVNLPTLKMLSEIRAFLNSHKAIKMEIRFAHVPNAIGLNIAQWKKIRNQNHIKTLNRRKQIIQFSPFGKNEWILICRTLQQNYNDVMKELSNVHNSNNTALTKTVKNTIQAKKTVKLQKVNKPQIIVQPLNTVQLQSVVQPHNMIQQLNCVQPLKSIQLPNTYVIQPPKANQLQNELHSEDMDLSENKIQTSNFSYIWKHFARFDFKLEDCVVYYEFIDESNVKDMGWVKSTLCIFSEEILENFANKSGVLKCYSSVSSCKLCADVLSTFLNNNPLIKIEIYFSNILHLDIEDLSSWSSRMTLSSFEATYNLSLCENVIVKIFGKVEWEYLATVTGTQYEYKYKEPKDIWNMKTFRDEEYTEVFDAILERKIEDLLKKVSSKMSIMTFEDFEENKQNIWNSFNNRSYSTQMYNADYYIYYQFKDLMDNTESGWARNTELVHAEMAILSKYQNRKGLLKFYTVASPCYQTCVDEIIQFLNFHKDIKLEIYFSKLYNFQITKPETWNSVASIQIIERSRELALNENLLKMETFTQTEWSLISQELGKGMIGDESIPDDKEYSDIWTAIITKSYIKFNDIRFMIHNQSD